MVDDRTTDGIRVAQLLASELSAGVGRLAALAVTDADPDVEPTTDGALAYVVRIASGARDDAADERDVADRSEDADESDAVAETEDGADSDAGDADDGAGDPLAEVYVQPDRVRVEFVTAPDAAATAASEVGLRVRPKAVRPPRTLVFVEDGAEVKRVLPAFESALSGVE